MHRPASARARASSSPATDGSAGPPVLQRLQRLDHRRLAAPERRPARRRTAGAAGPGPATPPPAPSAARGSPPRPGPPAPAPRPGAAGIGSAGTGSARDRRVGLEAGVGVAGGRGRGVGPRSPALPRGTAGAGSASAGRSGRDAGAPPGLGRPDRSRSSPATASTIAPLVLVLPGGRLGLGELGDPGEEVDRPEQDVNVPGPDRELAALGGDEVSSRAWATRTAASSPTIRAAPLSECAALISDSSAEAEGASSRSRASRPSERSGGLARPPRSGTGPSARSR